MRTCWATGSPPPGANYTNNTWLPRLERHARERLRKGQGLTLAHGDAHTWNFLFPRAPDQDTARIIDWQFWGVRIGAGDLAHFIAMNWYPERRRALERGLVRRYHDGLLERGVQGYAWDDCWHDYRLAVIDNLSMPVWMWSGGKIGPGVWWDKLEKTVLAARTGEPDCITQSMVFNA